MRGPALSGPLLLRKTNVQLGLCGQRTLRLRGALTNELTQSLDDSCALALALCRASLAAMDARSERAVIVISDTSQANFFLLGHRTDIARAHARPASATITALCDCMR